MHTLPPLSFAHPHLLTIVSPDSEQDARIIPYQRILSLAQVVKEEQLAAAPPNYVGRDSLNSTPDMYEHHHANPYNTSFSSHYQIVNTPLSPLSSAGILPSGHDARMPSLSPSPIDEQAPERAAVPFLQPLPTSQPRSAPHDQFQFTHPFLSAGAMPSNLEGHGLPDRYVFPPDRRMSEPTLSSHASATVESAPVFLSATARYVANHNAHAKGLVASSPALSSPSHQAAHWTPVVALKPDPESQDHDSMYTLPGGHSASANFSNTHAGQGAEPEPVSPLHSTSAYSASGSDGGRGYPCPGAPTHPQSGTPLSSSQATPTASNPPDTVTARASVSAEDAPFTPPMPSDQAHDDPASPDQSSSKTYSFVPLPGNAVKKRPRRRYDEIERLYRCSFLFPSGEECSKAYGTLNHLNAHIQMQRHGEKRSPTEFKELRKQWRKAKKDAELMSATLPHDLGGLPPDGSPPGARRSGRPHLGLRIPSDYGPEIVQSPSHLVSPSPMGPPSFGYPVEGGGAGYMHEAHPGPRTSGYPSILPGANAYGLPNLPSLSHRGPSDMRPLLVAHDDRGGHDWSSPMPTQPGPRYRYSDDRRLSLPGRPSLSNRSSWASDYGGYEYEDPAHEQQPPPPPPAAQSNYMSGVQPHFSYGGENPYQGSSYMPQHPQELPPTQEELERFPPTNTLLTPLPGYVPPSLDLGSLDLPPPSFSANRPTSNATTLLAPVPALMHGAWRREELEHESQYHGNRHQ